jgi:hypothetical protein
MSICKLEVQLLFNTRCLLFGKDIFFSEVADQKVQVKSSSRDATVATYNY